MHTLVGTLIPTPVVALLHAVLLHEETMSVALRWIFLCCTHRCPAGLALLCTYFNDPSTCLALLCLVVQDPWWLGVFLRCHMGVDGLPIDTGLWRGLHHLYRICSKCHTGAG